jgi:tetratricopeptide (TPR) repeat protein
MSVTVVTEIRDSRWPDHLAAILTRTAAGILIALSFVASISLCLVIPALIPWLRKYVQWLPAVVVTHLGYSVLAALAILAAGAAAAPLARFSRREVLFLRRFGDEETARSVTDALMSVSGSWRLVALDDRTLEPVSADRAFRWTGLLGPLFLLSYGAAGSMFGFAQGVGYTTVALLAFLLWRAHGTLPQRLESVLHGAGFLHAVGRLGIEITIALLVAAIVLLVLRWTMMPAFATTFALGTTEDADRSARGSIRVRGDVFQTQKELRRNAKRTVAARIAVVTVADALWRESVARFAEDASVVLIDVSQPTKHVIWEVEYLLDAGIPCVFVGAAPRLSYLTDRSSGGKLETVLRDKLDGHTVVSYVPSHRKSARRAFARAVRASLERQVDRNPWRSDGVYQAEEHMASGRSGKAIPLFEDIAIRRQQMLGPDHAVTLCALRDLATAYQAAKRHDEARVLFERILRAWEKQARDEEIDTARLGAREDLARACGLAGEAADAQRLRDQNLDDARDCLGGREGAPEKSAAMVLRASRNLASACQAAGLHSEAISLFKASLEACLRDGRSRMDTVILEARDDLAHAYGKAGQVAEALRLHKHNEAEANRLFGQDHPLTRQLYRARVKAWQATRPPAKVSSATRPGR